MATNNLTTYKYASLQTFSYATAVAGMEGTGGCAVHYRADASKYHSLNYTSTSAQIYHQDINSLKYAVWGLGYMMNKSGNGRVANTRPTFTMPTASTKMMLTPWSQVRSCLNSFGAGLPAISTNTAIKASFHNDIKDAFDAYKSVCRCNSDCGCNLVCTCNSDCGCNY